MKTPIKYLLVAAIIAFSFVKVFSKKNEKYEHTLLLQSVKDMPKIPNGDFEDWKKWKEAGRDVYDFKDWKVSGTYLQGEHYLKRNFIMPDSISPFQGRYSAFMKQGTQMNNIFPISVHPSSLHIFLKSEGDLINGHVFVGIELIRNKMVIDSGKWGLNPQAIERVIENGKWVTNKKSIASWTEITVPISNSGSVVDSARIQIMCDSPKLWVDDIFLK